MKRECLTIVFSLCYFYTFPLQFFSNEDSCSGSSFFFAPYTTITHLSGYRDNGGLYLGYFPYGSNFYLSDVYPVVGIDEYENNK